MKKKLLLIIGCGVFFIPICFDATDNKELSNEFVVTKTKTKKESVSSVKEDIAVTLQACHQQMSKNIIELAQVQQQIFDKIKDLVGACDAEKSVFDGSVTQLKEQRDKLKVFHEKLLRQQDELRCFLACF